MLCEKCKKNKATVLYKQVINGVASSVSLCAQCAPGASFGLGADINLFGGLFESAARPAAPEQKCNLCGATYGQIAREGKVGCAKCYETFADRLRGSIQRIHGATRHVGSDEGGEGGKAAIRHADAVAPLKKEEVGGDEGAVHGGASVTEELKAALAKAIAEERYEDAARIRDEIKEAEKNHGH